MNYRLAVSSDLKSAFDAAAADWQSTNKIDRFWKKDPSLVDSATARRSGWAGSISWSASRRTWARLLSSAATWSRLTSALCCCSAWAKCRGLCPEVLAKTFGEREGFPALRIVDSTDPAQIMAVCNEVNLAETLVVVASKSGSTLEPNIFKQFFFSEVRRAVGEGEVGNRFIAITDPGSKMEQVAKGDKFRDIFYGDPAIGGRYSALSNFGVVAATTMGIDIQKLLDEAAKAVAASKNAPADNPGVQLGLLLGTPAHNAGHQQDHHLALHLRFTIWAHGWNN